MSYQPRAQSPYELKMPSLFEPLPRPGSEESRFDLPSSHYDSRPSPPRAARSAVSPARYNPARSKSQRRLLKSTVQLGYLDSARVQVNKQYPDIGAELICSICANILWKPVACARCENAFCGRCIRAWINTKHGQNKPCPFNCHFEEKRAPPVLNSFLAKLQVSCVYAPNGCRTILPYDSIEGHEQICDYEQVPCGICGMPLSSRDQSDRHEIRQCFQKMYDKGPDHIQEQFMKLLETVENNQRRIEALEALLG